MAEKLMRGDPGSDFTLTSHFPVKVTVGNRTKSAVLLANEETMHKQKRLFRYNISNWSETRASLRSSCYFGIAQRGTCPFLFDSSTVFFYQVFRTVLRQQLTNGTRSQAPLALEDEKTEVFLTMLDYMYTNCCTLLRLVNIIF